MLDLHENMMQQLANLKEEFIFQEHWINLLLRGKFLLQNLSEELVVSIVKKMNGKSFARLMRCCKWVHGLTQENRERISIHCDSSLFLNHDNAEKNNLLLAEIGHTFIFKSIKIENFNGKDSAFPKLISMYRRGSIKTIVLKIVDSPFALEVLNCFQPVAVILDSWKTPIPRDFVLPNLKALKTTLENDEESFYNLVSVLVYRCNEFNLKIKFPVDITVMLYISKRLLEGIAAQNTAYYFEIVLNHPYQRSSYFSQELRSWPENFYVFEKENQDNDWSYGFTFFILCRARTGTVGILLPVLQRGGFKIIGRYLPTYEDFKRFIEGPGGESEEYSMNWEIFGKEVKEKFYSDEQTFSLEKKIETNEIMAKENPSELLTSSSNLPVDSMEIPISSLMIPGWKNMKPLENLPRSFVPNTVDRILLEKDETLQNILAEARQSVELRKKWLVITSRLTNFVRLTILQRGKFVLELIPEQCAFEMQTKSFIRALISSKWLSELVEKRRSSFVKQAWTNWTITEREVKYLGLEQFRKEIVLKSHFSFKTIKFHTFSDTAGLLLDVVHCFDNSSIFIEHLWLYECPMVEEMLINFQPKHITLCEKYLKENIKYPCCVERITVVMESSSGNRFESAIQNLSGRHMDILFEMHSTNENEMTSAITSCWEVLTRKQSSSSVTHDYKREYRQNSIHISAGFPSDDSIFIFTAKEETPKWKYEILMKKVEGGGAVTAFYIFTKYSVEVLYTHKIICAFIPTMKRFREIFENHVKCNLSCRKLTYGSEEEDSDSDTDSTLGDYESNYDELNEPKQGELEYFGRDPDLDEIERLFFS